MSHSLFRVVVVSVFAFSLNFVAVPAAQARMQAPPKAAVSTNETCMDQAMAWLNQILGKEQARKAKKKLTANDGGCIDPMGNPKPCV